MKAWILACALVLGAGGLAWGADYKVLRNLKAPPPVQVAALPADAKPRAVQLARIVVHPQDGEAWAIAYESVPIRTEGDRTPSYEFITWNAGRTDAETASFSRAFSDELAKAGFSASKAESLFDEGDSGGADLKIGVLIDDLKGRFCVDCPNLINRNGIPATVLMSAHWEVYSSLERKVIARIDTSGGVEHHAKLQGSVMPAVLDAFRENVRMLLASEDFRRAVTAPTGAAVAAAASPTPISLHIAGALASVPQASKSVAVVFAADGSGSGFLVSNDGYVLTNHHVVGSSKYVKLKWSDGRETLGEVIRSDPRRDVALIKTDAQGRASLAMRHGPVQQGETVFAIGTPLEEKLQNTMTKGIVSANRVYDGQPFIQSDVAVTHGNSGGPLIDEKGAVIGLTVLGMHPNETQSLNLFIPIDDALKALAVTPAS